MKTQLQKLSGLITVTTVGLLTAAPSYAGIASLVAPSSVPVLSAYQLWNFWMYFMGYGLS